MRVIGGNEWLISVKSGQISGPCMDANRKTPPAANIRAPPGGRTVSPIPRAGRSAGIAAS
tara:strand:- start:469 stop:648 length:180 start_codon:yes stop_codon:yes gene_type:complete